MRKLTAFVCALLFSSICAIAQKGKTVTGKITSSNDGQPLDKVVIEEKGTATKSLSGEDGSYSITLQTDNAVLVFSFVGFATTEIPVNNAAVVDAALTPSQASLDEVVVTAFGIRKEKRSLGYTVQQVDAKDLNANHQPNVVNALQGKVAGVQISSSGGAPGQGARIIIRGINSIDAGRNNQPLFIVDGVEIDNSTYTTGGAETRGMSNRASDINPDDIESVSVLRGGAATALYGIRAANGAILITTKSARSGRMQVGYNGMYGIDKVNKTPEVQDKFTQGYVGTVSRLPEYDPISFWPSWGPTIADAKAIDPTHPDQIYDNYKQAYKTGNQTRHTVNVTGGTDRMQLIGSLSYFNQNGVIPFSDYRSYNARVNAQFTISSKVKAGASINFINSGGTRINADRYGEQLIYWTPRLNVMDYINADGTQKSYGATDNPVYTLATNRFVDNVSRTIASTFINYTPVKWLTLSYRIGNDFYNDARTHTAPGPKGTVGEIVNGDNGQGFVNEYNLRNRVLTSTAMANITTSLVNDNLTLDVKLGHDLRDVKVRRTSAEGDTLVVPDLFLLQNTKRVLGNSYISDYRNYGVFADATLGWKNYLFLNVTGRKDFTSTLAPGNRSYFYPSASVSYIFSDHFKTPAWWNYGKLKLSYAKLGKDGDPYGITTGFIAGTPIGSAVPFTESNSLGNPNLRPEFTNTYEAGAEFRFLQSRLGLELVAYLSKSKDLLLPAKISNATGYDAAYLNAGEIENKGLEITLSAVPVQSKNFSWDFRINFSTNKNRVIRLNEDVSEIIIGSQFGYLSSNVTTKLVPGYAYGAMFGTSYRRYYGGVADDGISLYKNLPYQLDTAAFPVVDATQRYLGSSLPKWIASTMQTLRYKQFSLSVLFDIRQGQYRYNQFANFMAAFGTAKFTENRTEMIVIPGVDADGKTNTRAVFFGQGRGPDGKDYGNGYYRNVYRGSSENFIEDASWVRLRSVSLSYTLPKTWLAKSKVFTGATVSATGNNLWLKTDFTGFDPESSSSPSGDNTSDSFSGFTYPAVRSFLFSVNLQF
ncbi:SusC/RagA family TonB-linked outer membrane protein [Foetidibacter luteolus]|uniref:SusC/RagA family TonB-linked outer membrane protein n=1 Tax=Foetidibacter luteolus TaxID=2608880 RepID=UPI00129BDC44|nr:SusC/RagA family TonB-linked outer membrane protein [Foetidibacter luteolus]